MRIVKFIDDWKSELPQYVMFAAEFASAPVSWGMASDVASCGISVGHLVDDVTIFSTLFQSEGDRGRERRSV
jgi:hypothetical protein